MLHYLLQIVIFQVLFLVIYDLLHKKETFFNWNRVYLIITPFISLLLPFIKIEVFKASASQVYVTRLERVITQSSQSLETIVTSGNELGNTNWWLVLYFVGAAISLLLLVLKFYKLNILKKLSLRNNLGDKKIVVLPNTNQAFSFWNTIYLGDALGEDERERILIHEIVHVEQKHSLDQLYFEVMKIVLWWNPLVYYYQLRITELHEYMADAAVIITVNKRNYIEQLLNAAFQTQEITFVNQFFNKSLIKKRILMLQKNKSKAISKFKYLLLVPVITGILVYTSCSDDTDTNAGVLSSTSENKSESACLNENAIYDKKMDNFLEIETKENSEAIVALVNIETNKTVRSAHIQQMQKHSMKNIPEGKYRLKIIYGEGYAEEIINGVCTGYFKESIKTEAGEDIIDFNKIINESGVDVPSYEMSIDIAELSEDDNQDPPKTFIDVSNFDCLNKDAIYDKKLDNYLELSTAPNTEVIAVLVSVETGKSIRTVHLTANTKTFIRNIPGGKYELHNQYGTGYIEINKNDKCVAFFQNKSEEEEEENLLIDFTPVKTERGWDVSSYAVIVESI